MEARATGRTRNGHGGRPTAAEAARRREYLLEVAGAMFMERGFDGASVDAVAEAAGMSKRTVYAAYGDKHALFRAVLRRLIAQWLVPIHQFQSRTAELEPMLVDIGRHLLVSALAPSAISVRRIIIAESKRQPELGLLAYAEGWRRGVEAIATMLRRHQRRLRIADTEAAAAQFISLVIDNSLREATLGTTLDKHEIEQRVRAAVDLFLNGAAACRRSSARPPIELADPSCKSPLSPRKRGPGSEGPNGRAS